MTLNDEIELYRRQYKDIMVALNAMNGILDVLEDRLAKIEEYNDEGEQFDVNVNLRLKKIEKRLEAKDE